MDELDQYWNLVNLPCKIFIHYAERDAFSKFKPGRLLFLLGGVVGLAAGALGNLSGSQLNQEGGFGS